jgi:hypothetical protein
VANARLYRYTNGNSRPDPDAREAKSDNSIHQDLAVEQR